MFKDTQVHNIISDSKLESGRMFNEDEDELDNKEPDDLDLLHLDKALLKNKILSKVWFL
jgi:hypothetical protein